MLETCNAWQPGAGSVAEASFKSWVDQEEGRLRGKSKILYDARVAAPLTDLRNEESLMAALEFVYDDCWWASLDAIKERVWDSTDADARRKFLNQPTADEKAWVTPQEWSALAQPGVTVEDGEPVVLFFDGSKSRDATALIGCRMSDGHVFTVGVWEPSSTRTPGTDSHLPSADFPAYAAARNFDSASRTSLRGVVSFLGDRSRSAAIFLFRFLTSSGSMLAVPHSLAALVMSAETALQVSTQEANAAAGALVAEGVVVADVAAAVGVG